MKKKRKESERAGKKIQNLRVCQLGKTREAILALQRKAAVEPQVAQTARTKPRFGGKK